MKGMKRLKNKAFVVSSILIISILIFSGCHMKAFNTDRGFYKKADEYITAINEVCTGQQIHGSILVARDGEILFSKGYGKADYEKRTDFTGKTVFLIGSNTKPITAVAIMQLQEKGLLDINDPVSMYIPHMPGGEKITIAYLLTHTSGIERDPHISFFRPVSREELIHKIISRPLEFEPGTDYQYSNGGFSLLACIIEKVSGQTYEEYLDKNIFGPLNMKLSGAAASNQDLPHMAAGYCVTDSGIEKVTSTIFDVSVFWGSGNIYSTVGDLYSLYGALHDGTLLSKETQENMFRNGYGIGTGELNGHRWAGHTGLIDNGYSSAVMMFPDEHLTVIVLLNVSNRDNLGLNAAQALSAIALGEEYALPEKEVQILLGDDELEKFTGEYRFDNGNTIVIGRCDNGLIIESSIPKTILVPYSPTQFYARGSEYRKVEFVLDDMDNVTGLTFKECVVELKAKRID